jgi:menaquinol-cytochrome c reductase iron-sulfur subunit
VADELERPGESPEPHEAPPHLPPPSIGPFAFAGGIALVLVGLVVNLWVTAVGAVIAVVFGFLWIREATREVRGMPEVVEEEPAVALVEEEEVERFPRSRFLEGATLGLGALIGGVVTLPALGFMVAPAFVGQDYPEVDLGPLDNFPEGDFITATFAAPPEPRGERGTQARAEGEQEARGPEATDRPQQSRVTRRTAFVRNNGMVEGVPSLTVISNRCVHLGCPTQPQGLPGPGKNVDTSQGTVTLRPVASVSGFGCPCHGGAYDDEGNRTAGPPVRSLDRYTYSIKNGNVWLGKPYSVAEVEGKGAEARIKAYRVADPGIHVDGPEQFFYPYAP